MKKLITLLASLILVSSMAFGEESADTVQESGAAQESSMTATETSAGGVQESSMVQGTGGSVSLSKGDSFMVSVGMGDSSLVVGGEVGGGTAGAGVSTSAGSGLSNQGMNPGHTPYTYTK